MMWMLVVLFICASFYTADAETFINTVSVFELWTSARAAGMGGAFVALADDEAAVYYNPAGLAFGRDAAFSSLFNRPFGVFSYGALSFSLGVFGSQFLLLDSDTLEKRDLYGNVTGTFRYTEMGVILGVGFPYTERVALGLQCKIYFLALPTQAFGFAWSPALLFLGKKYRVGIVWHNVVSRDVKFINGHAEPWCKDITVGLSWKEKDNVICLDFGEQLIVRGDVRCVRIGVENWRFKPFVFRSGINREGTTFGFSLYWQGMRLDFASLLHFNLQPTFVFALSYHW